MNIQTCHKKTINFIKRYWLSILWTIIVIYLSTKQMRVNTKGTFLDFENADKIVHAILYFTWFSITYIENHIYKTKKPSKSLVFKLFLSAISLGLLMELIQGLLPYRSMEFLDLLANTAGALISLILLSKSNKISNLVLKIIKNLH